MNKTITTLGILAVIGITLGSYWLGHSHSKSRFIGISRGALVSDLTALQFLRTGQTNEAIERIEAHCFVVAAGMLDDPMLQKDMATRLFMPELVKYRSENRSHPADWTPTEKTLEELLTREGWKQSEQGSEGTAPR